MEVVEHKGEGEGHKGEGKSTAGACIRGTRRNSSGFEIAEIHLASPATPSKC